MSVRARTRRRSAVVVIVASLMIKPQSRSVQPARMEETQGNGTAGSAILPIERASFDRAHIKLRLVEISTLVPLARSVSSARARPVPRYHQRIDIDSALRPQESSIRRRNIENKRIERRNSLEQTRFKFFDRVRNRQHRHRRSKEKNIDTHTAHSQTTTTKRIELRVIKNDKVHPDNIPFQGRSAVR